MRGGFIICQTGSRGGRYTRAVSRRDAIRQLAAGGAALIPLPIRAALGAEASAPLQEAYDRYSGRYDELDDGPLARLLGLPQLRKQLLHQANGKVLEVAVGTGLNLPLYEWPVVESLAALDLSTGMLSQAERRAEALALSSHILFQKGDVTQLPFQDGCFDSVVDTFSLCVFEKPQAALNEMARVLKPDGRLLLLEHTLSSLQPIAWYQDLTAVAVAKSAKGCVWNQRVPEMVEQAGLTILEMVPAVAGSVVSITAAYQRP
ncbi:hypothetical protein WJX84_009694 [Apatococcus fuscideae]|uniref:Methyltransferase type 11 domain-containing protein n=1 Tax=Apatococcus fuscideae TaxID=2026836 RepID=A0AAW1T8Z9_9CHLO